MPVPLRALIVEDSAADAEMIGFELRRQDLALDWRRVETEEEYLPELENPPDVILADYTLPRFGALRALALLGERGLDVPFIVVTGNSREEVAVECMKAGASDFLVKDRLARLAAAVRHAIEARNFREEKARAERERAESLAAEAAAERRFHGIIDAAHAFVGLLEPDGTLLEVNRAALDFAGVRREDVVGCPFWEGPWWSSSGEGRRRLRDAIAAAAKGETVRFEIENDGANGRRVAVDFSITPIRDEAGQVTLLVPEGYDVSARKAAEDELRQHRERLEELVRERTEQLLRSERRAQLVRDVASAANAARTAGEALLAAIRCVAGHWRWPVGHAFLVGSSSGNLHDSGTWHLSDGRRFDPLLRGPVPPGESASAPAGWGTLFRDALETGLPTWASLPSPAEVYLRGDAACASGLGFVCALPVKARGRDFAVLEFLGEGTAGPDADDLEVMRQVGHQVAVTCDRLDAGVELRKLSVAVAQSPASVLVTDREGRIQYVNPAFERSTGWSSKEAAGQTPRILKSSVHGAGFYEELWATILRGETWRGELCNRRRDGELFWESASISPLRSEAGEITGFVAVKLDVSDRKEAERALERAKEAAEQANRAKSVFLANMSHEIRTPLNSVLGFSQLLMGDEGLTPTQREHLASIHFSGEHLLALINDILEMSKIEAGRTTLNPAPADLHALLTDVERMFRLRADEKRLAFEIQRIGEIPDRVVVDETKLRQILVNLVGNAMKFTREGGVLVRVRSVPSSGRSFRLFVEVEDTGPGIAEEDASRLFQQFEQARAGEHPAGGTGLGLAISRAFARLMGGDVTVRSRPGVGSVFSVEVSAELDDAGSGRGRTPPGRVAGLPPAETRRHVLVVDDVAANRVIASLMLRRVGFEVRTAEDGPAALAAFAADRPDLVLMDLRMPGMDGLEAIRSLRAMEKVPGRGGEGGPVPIIALTASAFEEDRQRVREAGGTDFVGKPFREADLLRKVGDALGIRYVLEGETPDAPSGAAPGAVDAPAGAAAALAALAGPLREELRSAVVRADLDLIQEIATRLEREEPPAAALVRDLAERFEYGRLLDLLGEGAPR